MLELTVTSNLGSLAGSLRRLARDLETEVETTMRRDVEGVVRRHVEPKIPVKTGKLKRGTRFRFERRGENYRLAVSFEAPYARYVEEGTRPHTIKPKPTRKNPHLRFPGRAGDYVFARQVDHPGTKATHFLRDGVRAAAPEVRAVLWKAIGRAVKR